VKHASIRALFVGLLAAATLAVAAPPEGKGKPNKGQQGGSHGASARQDTSREDDSFSFDEAAWRSFVREQHYGGYQALPPGIRKNLARGKPLPPGLALREVPPDLLLRLPHREGYEWRVAGADVVLYSITSGIVDQVLRDVFFD
jgi:hypothetical protein